MADASNRSMPAAAERRLAIALIALSLAWALVVGSNLFQISSWIVGDIAYHRGVAYTMQGVAWQGEGPYAGLLSYYGGLYPLLLGRAAALLGLPFDTLLSVASWGLALLWPLACWWLGRRIWPNRPLAVAVFVILATTAAPFTHRVLIWVDSPLASAQNAFPIYPRDLALVLLVIAIGMTLGATRRARVLGTGLAIGGIVLVHLQVALLAGWLVAAWAVIRTVRERDLRPLGDVVAAGLVALVVSAWWWIPRAAAVAQSGGLWLGGFPGAPPLRLGPDNLFTAFGIVGVFALLGLSVMAARRPLPGRLAPFLVWIVALLPLIVADRLVGGSDLLSERRAWLLISIPLMVLAAATAALIATRLRPVAAAAFVAVVVIAPSVPGTIATARTVHNAWEPGRAGGRVFDAAAWEPLFADLNRRVQTEGRHIAVTYDAYETWIWSFSGAQVPSLWLPGPVKLGFDPARLTGIGHLDRLRAQEAAFTGGPTAICSFARSMGGGSLILDAEQGMVGIYDSSPASPYRVDPRDRSIDTIQRRIEPGVDYVDRGGMDALRLSEGAIWRPAFQAPTIRALAVEIIVPLPPPGIPIAPRTEPLITITTGGVAHDFGVGLEPGPARVVIPVTGVDGSVTIEALGDVDLIRMTGFESMPNLAGGVTSGPFMISPAAFCAAT